MTQSSFLYLYFLPDGSFVLAGIDERSLLQAVETAVEMNKDNDLGIPVPDYVEENVSPLIFFYFVDDMNIISAYHISLPFYLQL